MATRKKPAEPQDTEIQQELLQKPPPDKAPPKAMPSQVNPRDVFEAMGAQSAHEEAMEARTLSPEHLAKVARTRVALAQTRTDPAHFDRALQLNARDLGVKAEEYREMYEHFTERGQ